MGLFGSATDKLFKAAGAGNADAVVKYAKSADLNACNSYGRTPLTVAVFRPKDEKLVLETVKALLARGADVNLCDSAGNTALIFACWKGYVTVVDKLLAAGAVVDCANHDGNTALVWASMLGHAAIVRKLLENGATVDLVGPGGKTPLHFAAAKGHSQVAQLLLAHGADPLAVNDAGRSSIASAEHASHPRMADLLRSSSMSSSSFRSTSMSDSMFATTFSDGSLSATMPSSPTNATAATEAIVVATAPEQDLNELLLEASAAGDLDRVTACLVDQVDINTKNETLATPLMLACANNHQRVVEALLIAEPDIDLADSEGDTALIHAARKGYLIIVAMLLLAGADIYHVNERGETAASTAVDHGHVDVVRELVAHDPSLLESTTDDAQRPSLLHCAAASDHGGLLVMEYLIQDRGVDVNAVDGNGVSALQLAVVTDDHATVGMLLAHGARVDQKSYRAASSPAMQATLLRHNYALYSEQCVALLHGREPPPTIEDLAPLVPLITSVYDLRWLMTLVELCASHDGRTDLLHAAFDHILAMKLVFDTPACAYFKLMLENVRASEWLSPLEVIELDREAENINTESAEWVDELKRKVHENAWRLDSHEQCLRQVVNGVREVHAMVVENRRAVQTTMGQLEAVQAQVVAARKLHAQLTRHTSQVVEQLHHRLEICEGNVVQVATSLQSFQVAIADQQQQEQRTRKIKMLCSVVASVAGFVLAPVVKEIADAVVDLTNPIDIVQYVYGESDIARFLADQSVKHLPKQVQDQLAAFEITSGEFEILLREEIALKHPEYLADCDKTKWNFNELDGGRAEMAVALAPSLEQERLVVLDITAQLRVALSLTDHQQASTMQEKWRSPSIDLDDTTAGSFRTLSSAASATEPTDATDDQIDATTATNQRELVVFVDDPAAFPYHAAVQQCGGDVGVFNQSLDVLQNDPTADLNAEMRLRLCGVATWRESLCAAQYAYCLGQREIGDLLAGRMDPRPPFSTTAAAMAVEIVGETEDVPYIDFIHASNGDATKCEHFLEVVEEDEYPLSATVEADVVRVIRSSSVEWTAIRYASHLGYVEVVKRLIQIHGKQIKTRERMQLVNHALEQRSSGLVAAHAG